MIFRRNIRIVKYQTIKLPNFHFDSLQAIVIFRSFGTNIPETKISRRNLISHLF